MTRPTIQDLARLTAMVFDTEAGRVRKIARDEARLRADIAALDTARRRSRALGAAELAGPRAVGADLLWQAWMSRARADLHLQLARVLARKGVAQQSLRTAHARNEAAKMLADRARNEREKRRARARTAADQNLFMLTSAPACGMGSLPPNETG